MKRKHNEHYRAIVKAINEQNISKDELLRLIDDYRATKKITDHEYFEVLSKLEGIY